VNEYPEPLPTGDDADLFEQSVVVAPDDHFEPDPITPTWDADPADLVDQSIPVPLPDEPAPADGVPGARWAAPIDDATQ
jgi:hypothetical protein